MSHWSVMVTAATPMALTEDQAEALAAALGPDSALTLEYEPVEVSARFDVQARTISAAIANGLKTFTEALAAHQVEHSIEEAQAVTYEALERMLTAPQVPPLAGMAEIADMLGVSRQRAHEIADKPEFPKPVQELASGKLYARSAVEVFIETWPRKRTGRPKKAA